MKGSSRILLAAGLAFGLTLPLAPAFAQQPAAQQPQLKPVSPSAMAAARELLAAKQVTAVYANAVPNIVQRTKDAFLSNNLSYQKDLNEVAASIAQQLAGREKEIGEEMAKVYANDFTEQELKDLTTFYKSPLGQKMVGQEPKTIQTAMTFMSQWAQNFSQTVANEFREEMKKRGKPLS